MAAATARYSHDKTSPSLTDTSHTLSGHALTTTMAPATTNNTIGGGGGSGSDDVSALLESLRSGQRHKFLQPTAALTDDSLRVVKSTLEGFAGAVGDEQQRRLNESRKRKRGGDGSEVLRMRKLHVDGFETGQVWEQAKRIIGSVLRFSEGVVDGLEEEGKIVRGDVEGDDSQVSEDEDVDVDEEEDEELKSELGSDEEMVDGEDFDGEELMDGLDEEDGEEDAENAELEEDEEDEDESGDDDEEYVEDPHGLNDGFFSIDDFNKQTQWFEDQDARGDPNTDQVSDEDEIDWTADPKTLTEKKKSKTSKGKNKREATPEEDDEDEDSEDDEGPGFGNMDLYAPEGDSEDEDLNGALDAEEEDEDGPNANGVMYKDFFAPPAKKRSDKPRKERAPKKPKEADVERAMEDVKRDLFDDDDDDMSEEPLSDVEAGDPKSRQSAHERRQAKLAAEIKKLEAESVAKRQWTLVGEATAVERPVNSLLEEDLDFEHGGKPVPVITPEITEDIEALIKRRIVANEFDDILRRRPDADVPAATRRGLVDVSDKKNDKGLADVYEEDHIKSNNPDTYVSQDDSKLAAEEQEIQRMWKDISGKLDALSSWHYKPKPAAPALSVVADVATVAMEDVQPSTAQGVAGSDTRLAPQEVYSASRANAEKGETVTKGGAPLARDEMSREEKLRRRRREKERVRKAGGRDAANGRKPLGGRAARERDTMEELKRGGVKVINRRGEVTDVQGNKTKTAKALGSGSYKL